MDRRKRKDSLRKRAITNPNKNKSGKSISSRDPFGIDERSLGLGPDPHLPLRDQGWHMEEPSTSHSTEQSKSLQLPQSTIVSSEERQSAESSTALRTNPANQQRNPLHSPSGSMSKSRSVAWPYSASAVNLDERIDELNYSNTERWGWIILISTWIAFVVVMGSCLGVWTWAWDLREAPYGSANLEDDSALPVVGYYPALIVLTGVVSWVWVIVAWVGVKYFKHARIHGEDS